MDEGELRVTHDELLARIDDEGEFLVQYFDSKPKVHSALRAVVELLKDYDDGQTRVNEEFNQGVLALSNVIKEAIEKELR